MNILQVKVCLTHLDAKLPTYANLGDAGADIYAVENEVTLQPRSTAFLKTGLSFEIPYGWELQVRSRSGLAANHKIAVLNAPGTIDAGYRGEVKVLLINHSDTPYTIFKGDRIAQLVLSEVNIAAFTVVENLSLSERGANGFGSTGV
jgi:dUTP pyrophosphatase